MQGIYPYIPDTNPVPKQCNVAAILSLLFMVSISLAVALVLLYFYISTFRCVLLLLLLNAIKVSLGGSTDKTSKKTYT
jgi:hypothetical protein